ncbi:hypothetical protein [Kitasatospora cineracea]|uniref:ReqiPepy6 Gp37-like protein n=1 Tax=Kitasatospora cineracea TaxID=88074 RepID=A0A3N4RTE6_9ACTN|nr:hypothetical protein [Kitasatospora cineracea]RPE27274.1 hypothetical protein EDD38_7419 [Kitasatospora cineracea]
MRLTYLACDLRTGRVAEDLVALRPTQPLTRHLGAVTSGQFSLGLAGAPPEWEAATDPGRTVLVGVDPDTAQIAWSGITLTRRGGSSSILQLGAATPEAYLGRRYPGTYSATGADRSTVMAALVAAVAADGPPLAIDSTASGQSMDYASADGDDRTVLSQLQTISGMGSPEFTVDTVWADAAQSAIQFVLRIRPAIGVQPAAPEAVFDMPGCITDYELAESYEDGKGATEVIATGEGEGTTRALSPPQSATALILGGWCRWQYRYAPGSGITSTSQLSVHAATALAQMRTGTRAWSVTAAASAAPRIGRDWGLGDNVRVQITRSPRHPSGAEVVARAYGWALDPEADQVSPILLEDT